MPINKAYHSKRYLSKEVDPIYFPHSMLYLKNEFSIKMSMRDKGVGEIIP